ncbi:MAG: GreA/GreB family elongation factor [Xanthobacteraceae bacterium]
MADNRLFGSWGEDEADPSQGLVSHAAPIARAVMGRTVGETVEIGGQEATIIKIN